MDEIASRLTAAIISSYFLELLKNSNKFKFLNEADSGAYKGFIGFITAIITTVGISYTLDYDYSLGGRLIISIPSLDMIVNSLWSFIKQWALQQASYDGLIRNKDISKQISDK